MNGSSTSARSFGILCAVVLWFSNNSAMFIPAPPTECFNGMRQYGFAVLMFPNALNGEVWLHQQTMFPYDGLKSWQSKCPLKMVSFFPYVIIEVSTANCLQF